MITSINKRSYPNTLIVILAQDNGKSEFEEKMMSPELRMKKVI